MQKRSDGFCWAFPSSPSSRGCGRFGRQADMWMTILSFIGGPVIKGLIDAYTAKLKAGNVEAKIAADLAAEEIAAQVSETNTIMQYRIAEIGRWYEPDKLMGYFVALYFGKLLVWDKVLGLGTTDPSRGSRPSHPISWCRSIS